MLKQTISALFLTALVAHAAKPNIVFVLIDDMGWTGTSIEMDDRIPESKSDFYQTPNIDALARQGMRFSRAYAPGSMCTPSRAAILAGKTPAELHMTTPGGGRPQPYQKLEAPDFVREFPQTETTIAEMLKKEGYSTAHFGKWHLGSSSPGNHGFDVHDGATGNDVPDEKDGPKDIAGLTARAIDFMTQQAKAGKPFYLQISHYAAHTPFEASDDSMDKFAALPKGKHHTDVACAAMTYDLDASIGELLAQIDVLGLTNNTYVVVMSDNGAAGNPRNPQNDPLSGGKGSLYEGGIRVPLIIRGPDIAHQRVCRENVTGCDLFPTFCEWAGTSTPTGLEGSSLVPLLNGKPISRAEATLLFYYPHYGQGPNQKPQAAIIVGKYKMLKDLETGSGQLFDLDKDLSERYDLARKMPEKTEELERLLERRLKEVDAQMPAVNPNYDPDTDTGPTRRRRNQ